MFFTVPIIGAYRISNNLDRNFNNAFGLDANVNSQRAAFSFLKLFTEYFSSSIAYKKLVYKEARQQSLSLDFYPSRIAGYKPCVVVVHGGSWAGGDSQQLPELNSFLAKAGYNVASINYRLAPANKYPAPIEDLRSAVDFLKQRATELYIDTNNIVLLGRSAGGQIVLDAAYIFNDPAIKGVISFYGPADMVWGYANPTNPLVLNSRKVMEDYLGGTYKQVPQQYVNSSATESISVNAVPTLLIHGENDPLVGYEHATRLSKKLQEYHIKHFTLKLFWATHGCDYTLNGPSGQLSTYVVERFLKVVTGQ